MRKISIALAFGVLLLLNAGCPNRPATSQKDSKLKVVATTAMVGDFAQAVAGDLVDVTILIRQGVDPHLYRPTSSDVSRMMQADILFYSGLKLEGAMDSAFESAKRRGNLAVAVTSAIPEEQLSFAGDFGGHPDPHVWHDPVIWTQCAVPIIDALSEKLPEHRQQFEDNAKAYQDLLQELHQFNVAAIGSLPDSSRDLVTAHDAFGYFSRRYQLRERSVQGISTDSEPGVQDINQLVDFLVEHKVAALFVEATVNPDSLNAVLERTRQRGWTVKKGGELYSDSMGAPGTIDGTYVGMIRHNVLTIVTALGGQVPQDLDAKLIEALGRATRTVDTTSTGK